MATLLLDRVWINLMDTGEWVSGYSRPERPQQYDQDGEVLTFAGGRQRAVTVAGERGTVEITLRQQTMAVRDLLRSWIGRTVQVRDHRGQVWVGTYFRVTPTELRNSSLYDLTVEVRTVTAPEGV